MICIAHCLCVYLKRCWLEVESCVAILVLLCFLFSLELSSLFNVDLIHYVYRPNFITPQALVLPP